MITTMKPFIKPFELLGGMYQARAINTAKRIETYYELPD
jgi:hypothetical protein